MASINWSKIKGFFRRAFWLVMILPLMAGVIVGVIAFVQSNHQNNNNQTQPPTQNGKKLPNFMPIAHVDSLQKIDQKAGSGPEVKSNSTVTVVYSGAVAASGIIFDSSENTGQPATFQLNQVIKGWADGLQGMKAGGQRRLLIPAALGYGATPPAGSGIPANADLVFDVTLLDVK